MTRVILQVPMPKELKNQAEKVAREEGFSSLQEIVRMILHKFAKKEIRVSVHEEPTEYVKLSPEAEARYEKIVKDIEAGKNITKTKNVDELLALLRK